MKNKRSITSYLLLFGLFIATGVHGQVISISGHVTSAGEPLPGATIVVKDKPAEGTVTDINGYYQLRVDGNATLIVSYIGYEQVSVPVNRRTTINVELRESAVSLSEVEIVVPYRTVKRSTFTGSASHVGQEMISQSQVSNVSKALQGSVAGLQSFSSAGQPGSDATIRIRGVGSINANASPLYVVDGVPYQGALSSISSEDIESVTVMKDAASANLYGSRAANGVVIITTKQGQRDQRATVELSAKYGISDRARRDYDQVTTNEYFPLFWEAVRNYRLDQGDNATTAATYASSHIVGMLGINPYGTGNPQPVGTDGKLVAGLEPLWDDSWLDALSQSAHYTDISLSARGGGRNSTYFLSGGFLDDQGIALGSGFKRYTLRANITSNILSWLMIGANVSGTHSLQDYPMQSDSNTVNVIGAARSIPSFYPVYERDPATGAYIIDPVTGGRVFDFGKYRATSYANQNLACSMPYDISRYSRDAATVRAFVEIKPIKDLSFRSSINVDYNSRFYHEYRNPFFGEDAEYGGYSNKSNVRTTGFTFNNVINYTKTFNKMHKLSLLAGHEYYEYNTSNFGGTRQNVLSVEGFVEPDAASVLSDFYGNSDQLKMLSFFGNADYSFRDRYFLSASVRSDASSRFHPDNRWGTFWSLGGSWRIGDEAFLESAKESWLYNLMLRASYGASGNDNLSTYYAYQALYTIQNNLGESGLRASRLATPNLSWESNLNLNIGLDFALFHNRLSGTIEFFDRRSKDLLFDRTLVPSVGFSSVTENIGAIKNYGWEFTVSGYPISTQDWKWRLSVNATTYKNVITALPSPEMWSGNKKWVKGGSLYDFYMIEWAGIDPTDGNPRWYYYDTKNNNAKTVTDDYSQTATKDRVYSGCSLPDVTGGLQSDLSYKGITLSTYFSYVLGGKIYNGDKLMLYNQGGTGRTWSVDMLRRWTPENPNTDVPRLTTSPKSAWTNSSTRFLVDRSFLRLKTMTLSYQLPKSLLSNIKMQSANIFVQAENLLTFTKEQGFDPEQTFDGSTYYRYPAMRTISIGFNVKL